MNYSDILHIYSILDGKYSDVFRGKGGIYRIV